MRTHLRTVILCAATAACTLGAAMAIGAGQRDGSGLGPVLYSERELADAQLEAHIAAARVHFWARERYQAQQAVQVATARALDEPDQGRVERALRVLEQVNRSETAAREEAHVLAARAEWMRRHAPAPRPEAPAQGGEGEPEGRQGR